MPTQTKTWIGEILAGDRYEVRAKLGQGGMAEVYRAWDRNLSTDVVIKAPHASLLADPQFADRFRREVRSLVQLAHPHVVRITDVGEHDGVPFAVLQYLSGGSLEDHMASDGGENPKPCDIADLSGWLPEIARTLDAIHQKGYVHRDVKPANILFDEQRMFPRP